MTDQTESLRFRQLVRESVQVLATHDLRVGHAVAAAVLDRLVTERARSLDLTPGQALAGVRLDDLVTAVARTTPGGWPPRPR